MNAISCSISHVMNAISCSISHLINAFSCSLVSDACFLAGGVLNCDLSHRRSVAVLCMLYKIRCNSKHPLCGTLPEPYVPFRVTGGAFIAHRYIFAPPRCRISQYRRTFIPLSVSLWNDLVKKKKVKSSMAKSLLVENLLPQPQNVGSIINYLQ